MSQSLIAVVIKPNRYLVNGTADRFRRGFMPNTTVPHIRSMAPPKMDHLPIDWHLDQKGNE